MTQDNLIARLRTTWDDLSLIGWGNDARNVEEAIERLSPPLDGEGVIQADRDAAEAEAIANLEWEVENVRGLLAKAEQEVANFAEMDPALKPFADTWEERCANAAHMLRLKEAILDVVRDRDEWRTQHENLLSVRASDLETFAAHRRAALATLTPREQIRAEAFEEAAKVADRWTLPGDLDGDALRTIARQIEGIATAIRALSSLPAPSDPVRQGV